MELALIDLDSMIHIVAPVQFNSGNRTNKEQVKDHVRRFYSTIRTNSKCDSTISFYQKLGHTNFRKKILPEYKAHRQTSEAVALWKPIIIEAFDELGAVGLQFIESDDAINALARKLDGSVTVVSSDKDMEQTPSIQYNPFKAKIAEEARWNTVTKAHADKFIAMQTVAGDPTDMPNELCGIPGIGMKTAYKKYIPGEPYGAFIQRMYKEKFGDAGNVRGVLTYRMVRLLQGNKYDLYAGTDAMEEISSVLSAYKDYIKVVKDDVGALFGIKPTSASDLFK